MSSNDNTTLDANWRKASYSNGADNCVQIGAIPWRKASQSNGHGSCTEASTAAGTILIRDTKNNGHGSVLRATPADWHRFTASLKR